MTVAIEDKSRFTPTNRAFKTLEFSTVGETELLDIGGSALAGIELSTGVAASLVSFSGSMASTRDVVPIHNAIGGRIALGSTSTSLAGKMLVIDPPMFAALRYIQVATITSTGGTVAQSTSDSVRICVTDRR